MRCRGNLQLRAASRTRAAVANPAEIEQLATLPRRSGSRHRILNQAR